MKAGGAGNSFCVSDTITLTRAQDILNFADDSNYIVEKFGDFRHVVVKVSNDEAHVRDFALPTVAAKHGFELTLLKDTGYSVSLNGVEASRYGKVNYKVINSKWVRSNPYTIQRSDFDKLTRETYTGSREMYMQTLLNS